MVQQSLNNRNYRGEPLKIGAYQFAVTKNINQNLETIKKAIVQASLEGISLLVFPECALTGYPPRDMENSASVNFNELTEAYEQLQNLALTHSMHIVVGTITKENDSYHNSAIVFRPQQEKNIYHKRALWGWDKDNFSIGNNNGVFEIEGLKIGVRICFEVRFPEFFRELYREHTDLNVILFYDASDYNDIERYDLIKSHIRTRAVENVTHTLSVNTIRPYQTAPTMLYDKSGVPLIELNRNEASLLVYDLEHTQLDFGEQGRKQISDWLIANS